MLSAILKYIIKIYVIAFISNLHYCACYKRPQCHDIEGIPANTPYYLDIPSYLHTGQAVHPDIRVDRANTPSFVMAFTPYPFSMDGFENPSVVISDDGIHFTEEKTGLNPLVQKPKFDHNDDPDIFIYNGLWCIMYLETLRPEAQNLILLSSPDRVNWSRQEIHSAKLGQPGSKNDFILSPAVINGKTGYYLFYVTKHDGKNVIHNIHCNRIDNLDFSSATAICFEKTPINPWHLDVIGGKGMYYMLISAVKADAGGNNHYTLYLARSANLDDWELSKTSVLENAYRSTGFVTEKNDLIIYFSQQTGIFNAWRIGVYRINPEEYFKES